MFHRILAGWPIVKSRWLLGLFLCTCVGSARSATGVDFSKDVQPLLDHHCAACHGAEEQNGGLRFDLPGSLFVEADSGRAAVHPGQPQRSELVRRLIIDSDDERMPPEGERLTRQEVDLIRRWIAEGAVVPDSRGAPVPEPLAAEHWAFQALSTPVLPAVQETTWPRGPLDRFVQARRESAGLEVAPDAEPAALLRRLTYGLTGLPPTPEQWSAFQQQVAAAGLPEAVQRLADELLNSPGYGQRWGRHWMDWVRYADTAGDNSDYPIPEAYLYRNYIIDSLNQDLPYDRFLVEQLAGDLLPADSLAERNRQTIATGYLALARRFGSLVERYPWHLTIEDTIDNLGRTMLGLTISCARCHDHKFDPISTRDYYGLYGIFDSTRYPFPGLELFKAQRHFVSLVSKEKTQAVLGPFEHKTEELSRELHRLLEASDRRALENAAKEGQASLDERRRMQDELDAMLLKARRAGERLAEHLQQLPELPTAYAVSEAQPNNARIQIKGEPTRPGAEVPRKFLDVLGGQRLPDEVAETQSGRLQLAHWIANPNNPLTARVIVNRVWQRHFGRGLVASTSDFGLRGELPSHPDLLDWLAADFMRHGWSLKHLHRTIITSHTYQLSSQDIEANLAIDPANHFLWKFNRQRLDAESLRDALLLIGGTLDTQPQLQPHPFPPKTEWKFTQHHPFKDDYQSSKRSVYLMTKRLTAKPYFQTFDGPDPNVCTSDRDQSVTALQALYFVNDEFLHLQAANFSARLLAEDLSDAERIERGMIAILGRTADETEMRTLTAYLAGVRGRLRGKPDVESVAWESLTRSLLRLNEFLYVD